MSFHSLPIALGSLFSLLAGCFIYFSNRKSQNNISLSLFCFSLAVWLFGYAAAYSMKLESWGLFFCRIACTGAMFTAPAFYHFSVSFLHKKNEMKAVKIAYSLMLLIVPFSMSSNLFLSGVYKYYWGYYSRAGALHPLYLVLFFGFFLRGFYLLWRKVKSNTLAPTQKARIKFIFIAYIIALAGAVDYIPKYGFELFPFGFICEITFVIMVAYSLLRHKIINVRLFAARTLIFLLFYVPYLSIPLWLSFLTKTFFEKHLGQLWWIVPGVLSMLFATTGLYVFLFLKQKIENRINAKKLKYLQAISDFLEDVKNVRGLKELIDLVLTRTTELVGVNYASLYLFDRDENLYILKGGRKTGVTLDVNVENTIPADNALMRLLAEGGKPVVREELQFEISESESVFSRKAESEMSRINASVVIPSFYHKNLIAAIVLGEPQRFRKMWIPTSEFYRKPN